MASREDGGLQEVTAGYKYVLGVGVFTPISAGTRDLNGYRQVVPRPVLPFTRTLNTGIVVILLYIQVHFRRLFGGNHKAMKCPAKGIGGSVIVFELPRHAT